VPWYYEQHDCVLVNVFWVERVSCRDLCSVKETVWLYRDKSVNIRVNLIIMLQRLYIEVYLEIAINTREEDFWAAMSSNRKAVAWSELGTGNKGSEPRTLTQMMQGTLQMIQHSVCTCVFRAKSAPLSSYVDTKELDTKFLLLSHKSLRIIPPS